MTSAKSIRLAPIAATAARKFMCRYHYSGKVVNNSQIHLGVFMDSALLGCMQFGPSMDKSKLINLVEGTKWNGFIELNRMAFSDLLPRNSESRALSVAMRIMRRNYAHIDWVVTFADGTQCGDGTIYRASGFLLTGITKNKTIYEFPTGHRLAGMTIEANWDLPVMAQISAAIGVDHKYRTRKEWEALGAKPLPGYQFRYIYFLNKEATGRLTAPVIPYSRIADIDAGMYRGKTITRAKQAMVGSTDTAEGQHLPARSTLEAGTA